jgi:hypothetical protein
MSKFKVFSIAFVFLFAALAFGEITFSKKDKLKRADLMIVPVDRPDSNSIQGKSPKAACTGKWQGDYAYSIGNWYTGEEYYAVYQDPIELGCTETYPFEVEKIVCQVYNRTDTTINLDNILPIIAEVDNSIPGCPKPGDAISSGGWWGYPIASGTIRDFEINLADPVCVSGPYFAVIYCAEAINIDIVGLLADDPATARTCAVWNDWGSGWVDLGVEFGNNLCLWSEGQNSETNDCVSSGYITALTPTRNQLNVLLSLADPNYEIFAECITKDPDPGSVDNSSVRVSGRLNGPYDYSATGYLQYIGADLASGTEFLPGDVVTVTCANSIQDVDGQFYKNGHSWQFTTIVNPASPGVFDSSAASSTGGGPNSVFRLTLTATIILI